MFKERSHKKELLDSEYIAGSDLDRNLHELHLINKYLGGYRVSLNAIKKALKVKPARVIVDIGSGGGDTIKEIKNSLKDPFLKLFGIDLKEGCTFYAEHTRREPGIGFITDDYRNVSRHLEQVDILHAALFCHHLTGEEIVALIKFAMHHKSILIINDLERNPVAYYSIKVLTTLFSKSYLVKHDAPLSVLRGFSGKEWEQMLRLAGAVKYSVTKRWAFRHEVIIYE